jgi:hypothetical protein
MKTDPRQPMMGLRRATFAFALLASCGARPPVSAVPFVVEPGLANARTLNAESSENLGHDAIANGPESCPRGNVHAVSAAPFEVVERVGGRLLLRTVAVSASDETWGAEAGPHEIACLQMGQ